MGLTEQTSYTGTRADLIETLRQIERGYKKAEQKEVAGRIRRIIENWTEQTTYTPGAAAVLRPAADQPWPAIEEAAPGE